MKKDYQNLIKEIPKEVSHVTKTLEEGGFEAYLVGGCVRDLLLGREPKDWDITTNAKPEEIIDLFEKTVYENNFGTVAVCVPKNLGVNHETDQSSVSQETKYEIIEVTPYRLEAKYSDYRHPDEVKFSDKVEDDLKRRDFTVNALALSLKDKNLAIKDIFEGIKDIEGKVLRTVGEPDDRFSEDALRMLRAVRFSVELGFVVNHETSESILKNAKLIKNISQERIRDEFAKMIMSPNPSAGIEMLRRLGLLEYIIPELLDGVECVQGGAHIYDVYEHLLQALQHSADKEWPLVKRLSALFHDIGKPKTKRQGKTKPTFYGHEVVGARMAKKIMERLRFPKKDTELVDKFVRWHMFFSDPEKITLSAVRRLIRRVGVDNIWDLMDIRQADRVGMKKKEAPYRLRKFFAMIEEVMRDPISVGQLKINGEDLKTMGIEPGPRMGWILHALLEEVLEDPEKNTVEVLTDLVKKLNELDDEGLRKLGQKGREKKEELEEEELEKLHQKHGVRKD